MKRRKKRISDEDSSSTKYKDIKNLLNQIKSNIIKFDKQSPKVNVNQLMGISDSKNTLPEEYAVKTFEIIEQANLFVLTTYETNSHDLSSNPEMVTPKISIKDKNNENTLNKMMEEVLALEKIVHDGTKIFSSANAISYIDAIKVQLKFIQDLRGIIDGIQVSADRNHDTSVIQFIEEIDQKITLVLDNTFVELSKFNKFLISNIGKPWAIRAINNFSDSEQEIFKEKLSNFLPKDYPVHTYLKYVEKTLPTLIERLTNIINYSEMNILYDINTEFYSYVANIRLI